MPGMMDTVLNLGLNDRSVEGLAARTGNPRFAYDSYRRFIQMFGDVVAGVDKDHFEHALSALKADRGVEQDVDLGADDLRELVGTFKGIYEERKGEPFPQEPRAQLDAAVRAVFESWDNRRARDYRRLNRIPHDLGTAVNVQQMVFGNTGPRSGTGVAFTRSNVDRRDVGALRRLPHQRPGRGRRRGHPHAAARWPSWPTSCPRPTPS